VTRLAIVVVTHNARDDVARMLDSLATAPPSVPHEIVIVDNASTDGAPELVRSRFPQIRVIEAGGNLGFAKANNIAIRATASDLVLLLNPDTIVPSGAIDRLTARLDHFPDVAIIGPRIVDSDGHAELSIGGPVNPWREAARKTLLSLDARGYAFARRWIEGQTTREHDVEWVTGACLLVRRADADAVGLLDERYFLYLEDVDFCAAVRARGRRVLFSPVAQIVHLRGRSGVGEGGRARAAWHQSHLAYYRRHAPFWAPVLAWYQRLRPTRGPEGPPPQRVGL
jgi:N-acetylglucosaminyl-diphospho-decaprenol L-rhamnosyltransferase